MVSVRRARGVGYRSSELLELRSALLSHAEQEQQLLLPALGDTLPLAEYGRLATAYPSERLRALGTTPLEVIHA